jgi:hypothetical protein
MPIKFEYTKRVSYMFEDCCIAKALDGDRLNFSHRNQISIVI